MNADDLLFCLSDGGMNWLAGAPAEGIASSTDSGRSSANTVSVEPSTIACSTAFEFAHISGPVIVQ